MSAGFSTPARKTVLFAVLAILAAGCSKSTTPGASPCDGEGSRLVAFASDRTTGQFDIYLYDADNALFRLLKDLNSPTAADSSPALASDGQTIAFVTQRGANGTDILLYVRPTCELQSIPAVNSTWNEHDPAFSGDAQRLTFSRDTTGGRRIRLVNGTTFRMVPLPGLDAPPGFNDASPSPDRTANVIAFSSDRSGNADIYLYDRGRDSLVALPGINSPADDIQPSLTPDAHYLAFASNRAGGTGGYDVYLYDLTGHALVTPLTNLNSTADDLRPSISADGNYIAFQSNRAGNWDVFYYSRAGNLLATPSGLAGSSTDAHPSLRFP